MQQKAGRDGGANPSRTGGFRQLSMWSFLSKNALFPPTSDPEPESALDAGINQDDGESSAPNEASLVSSPKRPRFNASTTSSSSPSSSFSSDARDSSPPPTPVSSQLDQSSLLSQHPPRIQTALPTISVLAEPTIPVKKPTSTERLTSAMVFASPNNSLDQLPTNPPPIPVPILSMSAALEEAAARDDAMDDEELPPLRAPVYETPVVSRKVPILSSTSISGTPSSSSVNGSPDFSSTESSEGRAQRHRRTPEQVAAEERAAKALKEQEAALDRLIKARQKRKREMEKVERLYEELKAVQEADDSQEDLTVADIQYQIHSLTAITDLAPQYMTIDSFPGWATRMPFRAAASINAWRLLPTWLPAGTQAGAAIFDDLLASFFAMDDRISARKAASLCDALRGLLLPHEIAPSPSTLGLWPFATPRASAFNDDVRTQLLARVTPSVVQSALRSFGVGDELVTFPRDGSILTHRLPTSSLAAAVCLLASVASFSEGCDWPDVRQALALQIVKMLSDTRFVEERPRLEAHLSLLVDTDAEGSVDFAARLASHIPASLPWLRETLLSTIPRLRATRRLRRLVASQWVLDMYNELRSRSADGGDVTWTIEGGSPLSIDHLTVIAKAFRASKPSQAYIFDSYAPYDRFYILFSMMLHVLPDEVTKDKAAVDALMAFRMVLRTEIHAHIKEKNGIHLDRSKVKFLIERIDSLVMAHTQREMSGLNQVAITDFFRARPQKQEGTDDAEELQTSENGKMAEKTEEEPCTISKA